MNTGVEILLKRMADCPEDFHYDPSTDRSSKWNSLLMEALRSDVITEEEKVALRAEVTKMGRERFTRKVMQTLAGVEDEPSEEGKSFTQNTPIPRVSGMTLMNDGNGKMVWVNESKLSKATLDTITYEEQRQLIKYLDMHKELLKREESLKPKVEVNKKSLLKRIIK